MIASGFLCGLLSTNLAKAPAVNTRRLAGVGTDSAGRLTSKSRVTVAFDCLTQRHVIFAGRLSFLIHASSAVSG